MIKITRTLYIALCLTVITAVCQGCGSSGVQGNTAATTLTNISATTEITSNSAATATISTESIASEETTVTIKFLGYTDNFDPTTDYTRTLILERLGINIEPEMGNEEDKVNLILASGQEYDMIFLSNRNQLSSFIENGVLHDLTELIDQYGNNLLTNISQQIWEMVSVDGRKYALPICFPRDAEIGVVVREDWLNKLDIVPPTTIEEFYEMLVAFKDNAADLGGGAQIIPFAAVGVDSVLGFNGLIQGFGLPNSGSDYIDIDGHLQVGYVQSGMKDYVTFLNKLYAEALLDADFPATTSDALTQKMATGLLGSAIYSCWSSAALDAIQEKDPDANLVYLQPLTGATQGRLSTRGSMSQFIIVPKASKKAEEVIKYANAFLDEKNFTPLVLGTEGVHYEIKDGGYYPILPAFDDMNKGRWFYPVIATDLYTPLFAARAHKEESMGYMYDNINAFVKEYGYIEWKNLAPIFDEQQKYGSTLDAMERDNLVKMIIDKNELNKFDEFVSQWLDAGGRELAAAFDEWYQSLESQR